jgi:hypothetical protein
MTSTPVRKNQWGRHLATAGTASLRRRPHRAGGRPNTASLTVETDVDRAVAELRASIETAARRDRPAEAIRKPVRTACGW